nr:uncharacterized protein LOC129452956 [Misgurnus anguillicaudatus]
MHGGVVGAGGVKSVSVMEGDSVTLHTDDPDMQKYDVIRWRFQHKNSPIAEINRTAGIFSTYDNVLDGRFKDKLQLNIQTGSLDIRNIRTKHSGLYQVDIISTSSNYTIHQSFNVTLSDKVKPVSVIVGDPVTLQTHVTELQKDDLIEWWFVHDDSLIAQLYKLNKLSRTYDGEEGKFRGRLKLNDQTGDLTITDSKTEHTGLYEVKMSERRRSIQRRFSVHVSEPSLSSGEKAGISILISVIILLLIPAAVAAAAAIYFHFKDKRVLVDKGKSLPLKTEDNDIQEVEKIEWTFIPGEPTGQIWPMFIDAMKRVLRFFRLNETLIAEINFVNSIFSTSNDDLFRDKLKLNPQTGDLTINDIREEHTGVYILKITRGGKTTEKRFIVSVRGE